MGILSHKMGESFIEKYFSYYILLISRLLIKSYENMRNEIAKSFLVWLDHCVFQPFSEKTVIDNITIRCIIYQFFI